MRLFSSFIALLPAAAMVLSTVSAAPTGAKTNNIVSGKDFDRIVIVVFENQDYEDAAADPYFSTLAEKHNGNILHCYSALCYAHYNIYFSGVQLTNFFGLTHPSQPNYVSRPIEMYNGASALMLVTHMIGWHD